MKDRPNVLIATGIFPPQVGGPATYSKLLLGALPKLGFNVKVESFGQVLFLPKVIRHLVYFFKLFFKGFWADIVYAQDPVSVGLPAIIVAKIFKKKFFLKIVGDYAWEQGVQRWGVTDLLDTFSVEYRKYSLFIRFLKKIELFVASRASKIIVPSHYLKRIVCNWGVNPNKIFVVHNSFDIPNISGSKEELKRKLGISGKIITSAGRLVPWKGYGTLIDLMPQITRKIQNTKLYIIGEGPDKAYLLEKIKKADLGDAVVLMGKMAQKDLFEYIKASDLFILNTSYEGFSHQILEVLALETPIITTRVGGNVEIIESGKNGILVEYNDKEKILSSAISILSDPRLADMLIKNGMAEIKNYKENTMFARLVEILRQ